MMKSTKPIPSSASVAALRESVYSPLAGAEKTARLTALICILGLQALSTSALAEGDEGGAVVGGEDMENLEKQPAMVSCRSIIRDLSDHYTFKTPGYHNALLNEFNSLQDRGEAAFPELLKMFRANESATIQMLAARALAQISAKTQDPAQLETVTNEVLPVVAKTIKGWANANKIQRKATAVLAHVKTDASVNILSNCVAERDDPGAGPVAGIFDPVTEAAMEALAKMDTEASVKALESIMSTASPRARERAIWAFRDHGGIQGARFLLPKLSEMEVGSEYLSLLEVIGSINRREKDLEISKVLGEHVDGITIRRAAPAKGDEPMPEVQIGSKVLAADFPTAVGVVEAMGAIGGEDADARILEVIKNDPRGFSLVHARAMHEISKSSSLKTAGKLFDVMDQREDAQPHARCAEAIAAICKNSSDRAAERIMSEEVIPELVSALMEKKYGFHASRAICEIGSTEDIAYLKKMQEKHPKFDSAIGEVITSIQKRETRREKEMAIKAAGMRDGQRDVASIVRRLARYDELMGVDTMSHGVEPGWMNQIGKDAVPVLLDIMRNYKDPAGRVLAARVLARISEETGDESLLKAVTDDGFAVLKQTLKDSCADDDLKGHIIETLAYIKTDESVELLKEDVLYSPRRGGGSDSLEALEKINTPVSRKALVSLLIAGPPGAGVFRTLGRVGGIEEANMLFEKLPGLDRKVFAISAMGLINQRLKDPGLDEKLNQCVEIIEGLVRSKSDTGWAVMTLDTIRNQKAEDLRFKWFTDKRMGGYHERIAQCLAESESLETAKRMLPIIDTRTKDHQKMKIAVAISSICRNTKDPGVDQFVAEAYGPKIISIINAEGTTEHFRINFTLVLGKACSSKNEDLIKQVKDPEPEVELAMDKALAEIRAREADKGKP